MSKESKANLVPENKSSLNFTRITAPISFWVGIVMITIGIVLFTVIYYPVVIQEFAYLVRPGSNTSRVMSEYEKKYLSHSGTSEMSQDVILPVDDEYSIVIPKINANVQIISDVSPFNENEYQEALTQGVAHARDTAHPNQYGNTFIFAHSAANWYQANRYNAVFYLLRKLEKSDEIYIMYEGKKYEYRVSGIKMVDSDALEYLKQDKTKKQLTLMTCWPPGTTLKRLIVTAEQIQ